MSSPTAAVRAAVALRDQYRCVACNAVDALTFQHRRAVGMGGSKMLPSPVDGLILCATCNAACEASMQTLALAFGWKARRWVDPTHAPVFYPHEHQWHVLAGVTRMPITAVVALDMMHALYGDEYLSWRAEVGR